MEQLSGFLFASLEDSALFKALVGVGGGAASILKRKNNAPRRAKLFPLEADRH